MKNCILTPTYEGHFKYITAYLESYKKYCTDSENTAIAFILSDESEKKQFEQKFASSIDDMNVLIFDIETIMNSFGINATSIEILRKYGHTSYQMLKKFYSMLYIDVDRFLVLDSESTWISPMNIDEEFDSFFENPFIVVSDFNTRTKQHTFLIDHFDATNYILGEPMKKMPFEHFMWFYNKSLIKSVIDTYGSPFDMMVRVYEWEMETKNHSVGLMETMLCLNYIYENSVSLGYRVIEAEKELLKYLGEGKSKKYVDEFFTTTGGGQLGIVEFPCDRLNRKNTKELSKLFVENNIYITRCDSVTVFNKRFIDYFLKAAKIKILAVGQEHVYLPDIDRKNVNTILLKSTIRQIKIECKRVIKKVIGRI